MVYDSCLATQLTEPAVFAVSLERNLPAEEVVLLADLSLCRCLWRRCRNPNLRDQSSVFGLILYRDLSNNNGFYSGI